MCETTRYAIAQTSRKCSRGNSEGFRGEGFDAAEVQRLIFEDLANRNYESTTTVTSTPSAATYTHSKLDDFSSSLLKRIIPYVPVNTLTSLRVATKSWRGVADDFITGCVKNGGAMVVGEKDGRSPYLPWWKEKREQVTQVLFLHNITKIGNFTCINAINLVVVEIPDGVVSIGARAFEDCRSLTRVSFPRTLRLIVYSAFGGCSSLENVDLLHTRLQELGNQTFHGCSNLASMTIPDSLKSSGLHVFHKCEKLVPFYSDVNGVGLREDKTPEIIAYLKGSPAQLMIREAKTKVNSRCVLS